MAEVTTGWEIEVATAGWADDNGWMVELPTDNANFVCHTHDFATGIVPISQAHESARAHLAEQHPGEPNPFTEDRPASPPEGVRIHDRDRDVVMRREGGEWVDGETS